MAATKNGTATGKNTGTPYEQLTREVFARMMDLKKVGATVKHNVVLTGKSGTTHQIDVYVEFETGGVTYKTLISCKDHRRSAKKSYVLELHDVLNDIPGQPRGILVSRGGFQKGAVDYARHHDILLYQLREKQDEDWDELIQKIGITMVFQVPNFDMTSVELDMDWAKNKLQQMGIAGGSWSFTSPGGREHRCVMESGRVTTWNEVFNPYMPEEPNTSTEVHIHVDPYIQVVDGQLYFTEPGMVGDEVVRAIFRMPASDGTATQVEALDSWETVYKILPDGIYLFNDGIPVQRVPLAGGPREEVIALTNVEDLEYDDTYYYMALGFPDFEQVRAPKSAPTQTEELHFGGRISASFFRWPMDPDHVYLYDQAYYRIDKNAVRGERIATNSSIALGFVQGTEHMFFSDSYSSGGKNVTRTTAMKWDDGELTTLDNESSSTVAETKSYYYVVRKQALLRYER